MIHTYVMFHALHIFLFHISRNIHMVLDKYIFLFSLFDEMLCQILLPLVSLALLFCKLPFLMLLLDYVMVRILHILLFAQLLYL